MPFPLPELFPLVVQYENGEMMCCDEGHWEECTRVQDLEEYMKWAAANLRESGERKIRIFKKPVGVESISTDTPVRLCYVGELLDPDENIQWTSHMPNMASPE